MSNYHNGLAAEDIAARLYEAQQGKVLERRWRKRGGEIDLIVELAGVLVFVEVKARKSLDDAAGAVSAAQQQRLFRMAEQYLAETDRPLDTDMRFDLVITDRNGGAEILENALAEVW